MKLTWKLLAIGFATMAITANAGVLLEPYVGYGMGKVKSTTSQNFSGADYGARVGWTNMGFQLGVEYMGGNFTDDSKPTKNTIKTSDPGVFVAFKFPVMVRAYATYFPMSVATLSCSGCASTDMKGTGYKIGIGLTTLPVININAEIFGSTYTKATIGGISGTLTPSVTTSGYGISVSAPFDL